VKVEELFEEMVVLLLVVVVVVLLGALILGLVELEPVVGLLVLNFALADETFRGLLLTVWNVLPRYVPLPAPFEPSAVDLKVLPPALAKALPLEKDEGAEVVAFDAADDDGNLANEGGPAP